MKTRRSLCLAAAIAALMPLSSAFAQNVATVNGAAIPKGRADVMVAEQVTQGRKDDAELRSAVKEELIRREVLSQEAKRKKLDARADVKAQMELAAQAVLVGAYMRDFASTVKVSDDQVKKEYDAIKTQLGDKEYKARHVLVEKDDEAKSIIEKLKKGDKFEDLAKASKDPGSKDKGGDLGWNSPANFVKPFSDAMVKLEKGKFTTEPVQSDFGFHVIRVDDVRAMKPPAFEEVKPGIAQRLQQQAIATEIASLRSKAKVE